MLSENGGGVAPPPGMQGTIMGAGFREMGKSMKLKAKIWFILLMVLAVFPVSVNGALAAVSVGPGGVTFPDNSVQNTSAVLPGCSSGGVLVNSAGAWLCGNVMPVTNGIATCVSSVCSVSACLQGFGDCDGNQVNGCEAPLTTVQNCGGCGIVCAANLVCSSGSCQVNPNSPLSLTVSGTPAAGFINNQRPVTVTANVQKVAGGPVPAGTIVFFAVTSGSGTLSSASSLTNASGNASVILNSSVEGGVTVTATAAPATGTVTASFSNPNKPGSIVLVANPTTGSTNNNGPVSLRATVVPADVANGTTANGTPVSFSILSGSGALSAASALTVNGIATVTLNSSVVGSINVNASAGTVPPVTSNSVSVPFITQPTLVVVKLATSGTVPVGTLIGGIQAVATANPFAGLTVQASDVTSSGAASGSLLSSNTANVASIVVAVLNVSGFPAGEVATLNYHVANGTFPLPGNFGITPLSVIDLNGVAIPGVSVNIQSVTIQ
jgi:hypothetical protein